jgi:phage terminase small subunit
MTNKENSFCQEYIIDFNGTQAAIRAGYSKNSARQIAAQLLSKLNIQARINELLEERKERVEVKQDRVIYEMSKMAFSNIKDYLNEDGSIDLSKIDDYNSSQIQEVTEDITTGGTDDAPWERIKRKIRLHDKVKNLELLGKHLNMYRENINLSGEVLNVKMSKAEYKKLRKEMLEEDDC